MKLKKKKQKLLVDDPTPIILSLLVAKNDLIWSGNMLA